MTNFSLKLKKLDTDIYLLLVATIIAISAYPGQDLNNSKEGRHSDIIFRNSTIIALLKGLYDDDVTFRQLRKHGNLGLGTFNRLDGEMVGIDGQYTDCRRYDEN